MQEMKRRLVTHRDCMDGSTCAIIFLTLFPDGEVVYVHPHEVDTFPGRGDGTMTIFADVCPTYFLVDETVVDHHVSNIEMIAGKEPEGAVLDGSKCGCLLLHETLTNICNDNIGFNRTLRLCEVVDDYDRWVHKRPFSKVLADYHQLLGQKKFVEEMLWKHASGSIADEYGDIGLISPNDRSMVKIFDGMKQRYVERACDQAFRSTFSWPSGRAIITFADDHRNDIMHELLQKHSEIDFAITIDLLRNTASIRSRDSKFDCAAIAKKFGGGGHAMAAGFPIPKETIDELRISIGGDE